MDEEELLSSWKERLLWRECQSQGTEGVLGKHGQLGRHGRKDEIRRKGYHQWMRKFNITFTEAFWLYSKDSSCVCMLSCVWLFETPWTVASQAPLSMGFSRQETGVGCHFLLQGIFLTQKSKPCSLCLLLGGFPIFREIPKDSKLPKITWKCSCKGGKMSSYPLRCCGWT